jgi:AcrR family transcriptional regulator
MKTNRDEILESAFQLFMAMNYERVSLQMITKKVGLTKTGIFNYYPTAYSGGYPFSISGDIRSVPS